jgi:hypothetical protein
MLWDSFRGFVLFCFLFFFFCGNNIELPPMLWDSFKLPPMLWDSFELPPMLWDSFDGFLNMATYVFFNSN